MRSLTITKHGGPEVLELRESADPTPKAGQVVIAVKRSGLNFSDITARVGLYRKAPPPPCVVGYEVAGVVSAIGDGVTTLKPGDRVFAATHFGGHATHATVDASFAVPLPERFSFEQGAALPVNYLTAFHMLFHVATLRPGDHVLVHMAASGVGLALIELCKLVPDVTIYGTASAPKHDLLKKLGVHHPIDYRTQDYVAEVRRLSSGKGLHLALDPLGGPDWGKSYQLLRPAGHLVAYGWANMVQGETRSIINMVKQWFGKPTFHPFQLMTANKSVSGVDLGGMWGDIDLLRGHLRKLMELGEQGKLSPHVDSVFPLSKGADAHRHVQARKNVGKVVFDCEA